MNTFLLRIFFRHEVDKNEVDKWTHMLNRKRANTPLLGLICASPLNSKRISTEFLEAQLHSSKGVLVLVFRFTQNVTPNLPKIDR